MPLAPPTTARTGLLLLALLADPAGAGPGSTWIVDRWTTRDGLPLDHQNDLAFDGRGYLWITTFDGLSRFDGQRFVTWRRSDIPAFRSNRFVFLAVLADGSLVVTDEFGAVYAVDPATAPPRVRTLIPEGAMSLVAATDGTWVHGDHRLYFITPAGEVREVLNLADSDKIEEVGRPRAGPLWVQTRNALIQVTSDGRQTLRGYPDVPDGPYTLREPVVPTPDGEAVWVARRGQVIRLAPDGDAVTTFTEPPGQLCGLHPTEAGVILQTVDGDWRYNGASWTGESRPGQGCSPMFQEGAVTWRARSGSLWANDTPLLALDGGVRGFTSDREGGVWVATHDGVLHARAPAGRPLAETARPAEFVAQRGGRVFAGIDGAFWAAPDGSALTPLASPAGEAIPWVVRSLRRGASGSGHLVAAGAAPGVLAELTPDGPRRSPIRGPKVLDSWTVLADGAPWFLTETAVFRGDREVLDADGASIPGARAVFDLDGGRVGLLAKGLLVGPPDALRRRDPASGLPTQDLRGWWFEPGVALWLGTEDAGLCRVDLRADPDPRTAPIACVATADGLGDHNVHNVLIDEQGRFWLGSNRGVHVAPRDQVVARLDGGEPFSAVHLDERDGMPDRETNGGQWAVESEPGWHAYPTMGGPVSFSPERVRLHPPGPPAIEAVRVNGVDRDAPASLILAPDEREVQIRWSVPEFLRPEQVEFRSRLIGLDPGWRVGHERERTWTNLPPGTYTLALQARLGGAWGDEARLTFVRDPTFTETNTFLASLVLGGASLAAAAVSVAAWWRGRARRQREDELAAEVQRQTARLREQNEAILQQSGRLEAQARQLAEVDAAKTRFVANLSHELRSPLMLVMAPLADLAGDPHLGPAADRVQLAARNAGRLKDLIDQLFDVVRLESGRLRMRARRVDARRFAQDLCDQYRTAADARGLLLLGPGDGPAIEVWADPDMLEKILVNLISNGLKFTPRGGRVGVSVALDPPEAPGAAVRLRVSDTGPGVPLAEQHRVFERFYQVEGGDDRRADGAGIGLSLARELAEQHGGSLTLSSEPGRGATFELALPLGTLHLSPGDITLEPPSDPGVSTTASPPAGRPGRRVLVVEDHPELRAYLAQSLSPEFDTCTAEDGRAALDLLARSPVDLVVSDLMMPGVDGLALTRALRAGDRPRIPIVLLTAKGRGAEAEALAAGADAFLQKPVQMRDLIATVRGFLPPVDEPGVDEPGADEPGADQPDALDPAPSEAASPRDGTPADPPPAPDEAGLTVTDAALLARIEAIALAHLHDPAFSVETLGKKVAMSRRTLQRALNRLTGKAPNAWLQELRLETGRRLLQAGGSVNEVADQVGYSPSYFTRLYTSWFGHPPSQEPEARVTAATSPSSA